MNYRYLVIFLCVSQTGDAAVRSSQSSGSPAQEPSVVYVPVPVGSENNPYLTNTQPAVKPTGHKEPNWFPYFMSIVGNIGKIFLNPHDRPHVKQHVSELIDNVVALAHEVSNRSGSRADRLLLIAQLMKELELMAAQLPQPIVS
jgi:cell wall assembly regulator SMI1